MKVIVALILSLILLAPIGAKADDYSLSCVLGPAPITSSSGFSISGNLGSAWAGHMGGFAYKGNHVHAMTGIGARFTYDWYSYDYYTSQWVFYAHATTYIEASRGLNPVDLASVNGGNDFDQGCAVDVSTDFNSWFHMVKPDETSYHFVLTGVSYLFSQSAEIYIEDADGDIVATPPGMVYATDTGWYTL